MTSASPDSMAPWECNKKLSVYIGIMEKKMEPTILLGVSIGIMEKKMETTVLCRGLYWCNLCHVYRGRTCLLGTAKQPPATAGSLL